MLCTNVQFEKEVIKIKYKEILNKKVCSIDKVRIEFKMDLGFIQALMYEFGNANDVGCSTNFKMSTCHFMYHINLPDDNSFMVGFCPNWIKDKKAQETHGIIEFNPNKVKKYQRFKDIFNSLLVNSQKWDIKRYDLACDIPVKRSRIYTFKDQRKYCMIQNSLDDKTEYLGNRNHHGFVKIYNKTLESKLDYILTRIELTLNYGVGLDEINSLMPKIFICDDMQFNFKITDTDMVLCVACLDNPNYLNMLGRRKKEKISSLLSSLAHDFTVSDFDYMLMLSDLACYKSIIS